MLAPLRRGGADRMTVLEHLGEQPLFSPRLKLAPSAGEGDPLVEGDRARGLPLAAKLTMAGLTRAGQMLLKELGQGQIGPSPLRAAQMLLVRPLQVAALPRPAALVNSAIES